jgi:hypothetical protein
LHEQRAVDFDTKEFTVELIVQKFKREDIFIPFYQRGFVWKIPRQSKFIESVILGLPIPFLFAADTDDGRIEIIDGSQRIQTLQAFIDNELTLEKLEKLDKLNGFKFQDLPKAQQRKFENKSLRMIQLSDKADDKVRFNIFERINTGSENMKNMEKRKGAYAGEFYNLLTECTSCPVFIKLCPISQKQKIRGEAEELVLRFFAYSEDYLLFKHDVSDFLNEYMKKKADNFDKAALKQKFTQMIDFVERYFPYGFVKNPTSNQVPRVRFEAISVGVYLALKKKPNLKPKSMDWLDSEEFKYHTTTHASNSAPRLRGRVECVRDALLGNNK